MGLCSLSPTSLLISTAPHHQISHRQKKSYKPTCKSGFSSLETSRASYTTFFRAPPALSSSFVSAPLFEQCYNRTKAHKCTTRVSFRACTQSGLAGSVPLMKKVSEFKVAFWSFLRPHTILGTAFGSTALFARALIENSHLIDWCLLPKALGGFLALICANGYIVGINQIYDIEIDKVNKPFLPIVAGDFTVQTAWFLVLFMAAAGLLIVALTATSFITYLYILSLFLGTIYSVPPFRLKRFPIAAFLIIGAVRGFLLNFGVYLATRATLGLSAEGSLSVAFITAFVTLFALVIAITKDLPDVKGDRKFQISTLATKFGVRNIAFLGSGILLANYLGAILAAVYMPQAFRRNVMIPAHTILASALIFQAWALEQANYTKEALVEFYRFIWKLFYAEYIIFPFI